MGFGGYIEAIAKHPGHPAHTIWIRNDLKTLQDFVEGYIETLTLDRDLVLVCNEEGKIRGMDFNATVACEDIVGSFLVLGTDGDEFTDVPIGPNEFRELYMEE